MKTWRLPSSATRAGVDRIGQSDEDSCECTSSVLLAVTWCCKLTGNRFACSADHRESPGRSG